MHNPYVLPRDDQGLCGIASRQDTQFDFFKFLHFHNKSVSLA